MSYKFNRNCWVQSREDILISRQAAEAVNTPLSRDTWLQHPEAGDDCPTGVQRAPIEARIRLADMIFDRSEGLLRSDPLVGELLPRLDENISLTQSAMLELGIVDACIRCDATAPGGSCCSTGLENKFDSVQLIINLLLGVQLPKERSRQDSCFFLGDRGCLLSARTMLCVDYLCPDLEHQLGHQGLNKIQTIAGKEITGAFLLSDRIRKIIQI